MEIIYIITYKCNLNCDYCCVKKKNLSISKSTINRSLKLLQDTQIKKIKFFGGEPLIEFPKLKDLVNEIKDIRPDLKLYLTTNATLLDNEKIEWIKSNDINLAISLDGNEFTQLKNRKGSDSFKKIIGLLDSLPKKTIFNLVIAPNTAKYFYFNFKYLVEKFSIFRFNILPAYYNNWTSRQLKILEKNFLSVLRYIHRNSLQKKIFLKNIENFTDLTFFNKALVIDCDGKIYNTNAFLAFPTPKMKRASIVGDLADISDLSDLQYVLADNSKIKQIVGNRNIEINYALDEILNNFIKKYKRII